jgi:aspartyl-tRNA(Asn)/glutamyl-tRNA(Gln) amidotransferase subunit C
MSAEQPSTLTADEVRKVARLSRLAISISDEQVELYRTQLTAVLRYADRLRDVDVTGVEPMPHVGEETNRLAEDVPGATLRNEELMEMAPDTMPPFIRVPKVLGDETGA